MTADDAALATYSTPEGRRAVKAVALAEYRCAGHGCLLFHVWRSPAGVMFYRPPYKLSDARNETESSAEGRKANTYDGENHWRPNAGSLEVARGWDGHAMPLQCDHVQLNVETARILEDADNATPGRPVRRRIPVDGW